MTEPVYLTATRAAYDTVAGPYAAHFDHELTGLPLERALFTAFAELTHGSRVADVGCGPGHVTNYLHSAGLDAFGVDLSPGMVAVARLAYPGLRFEVGSMTALDLPDGSLGGIVALYSIIHIPPDRLPDVFTEFRRVLAPGGYLLVAFQIGDESRCLTEWFGQPISLEGHRLRPEYVSGLLTDAGFAPRAQLVREPDSTDEKVPRAFLLAHKP